MSAAGKLLAMAKVLETPVKKKAPLKDHALPSEYRTHPPCSQRASSQDLSRSTGRLVHCGLTQIFFFLLTAVLLAAEPQVLL